MLYDAKTALALDITLWAFAQALPCRRSKRQATKKLKPAIPASRQLILCGIPSPFHAVNN
jgi:hypothetical protein